MSAFLVYSQRCGGKAMLNNFPNSLQHRRSKERTRLPMKRLGEDRMEKTGKSGLSGKPQMSSAPHAKSSIQQEFIRLHNYTVVFNKFCRALRWTDSTPCGPKRVGGTDSGIIASLELNRSRTHKKMDMALLTS